MPAGILTNTPDGYRQLTTDQVFFRLEQIITLDNSGWGQYIGGGSGQRGLSVSGISLGDVPLIALSSAAATYAFISGATASAVSWTVTRDANHPVTAYIFSQRRPPVSPRMAGCELFLLDGSICFSSDYPILVPLGSYTHNGYSGVDLTGRSIAHVPQKQQTDYALEFQNAGQGCFISGMGSTGYNHRRRDMQSKSCVGASGSSLWSSRHFSDTGFYQYQCSPSPQVPQSQRIISNGFRSLIIDVTNII